MILVGIDIGKNSHWYIIDDSNNSHLIVYLFLSINLLNRD